MLTLAGLFGAIAGTAVFNGLAFLITKQWPMSVGKIIVIGVAMFFLLSLGDNAVRENEPLATTFARIGIAQMLVTMALIVIQIIRPTTGAKPAGQ